MQSHIFIYFFFRFGLRSFNFILWFFAVSLTFLPSLCLHVFKHHHQVMKPRSRLLFGTEEVIEKFGVSPEQLCEYHALVGDLAVM